MRPFGKNVCLSFCGTLVFTAGVLFLFLWTWLFEIIIASMLVLKPNSQTLELWKLPPMPITLDFYFFNWTNPEDIHDLSTKPKFIQMGPYKFTEHREKVNLVWNDNDTVTYTLFRKWHFDEKNSVGKLTDNVTTLNAVTMSAANHIKDWSYLMKRGFSFSLASLAPDLHIVRTVGELLFDGYDDPFVNLASTFPMLAGSVPQFEKFGWFYGRNNSDRFDGVFNMNTGGNNDLGQLRQWNYQNSTQFFSGECSKIHGSAAEFYPSNSQRDSIGFFSPDMCRHVQLDYEKDVSIKGIDGYKYSAGAGMLDNGTLIPENECYCDGICIPSGAVNVSDCRYGTPAFVSLPHFYGADPIYTQMVDGLNPEQSKHELFIAIEPTTGLPLDVSVRLQLNIMVSPVEYITLFEELPHVLFPMLWFEQVATVPDHLSWGLWIFTHGSTICPIMAAAMILSGLSLMAYVACQIMLVTVRERKKNITRFYAEEVPLNDNNYSKNTIKRKLSYLDIIYS